jgi:hypothetical protein
MPDAPDRRVAGGYIWREELRRVIRSEEDELVALRQLVQINSSKARELALYTALLMAKIERIGILQDLLRYRDGGD